MSNNLKKSLNKVTYPVWRFVGPFFSDPIYSPIRIQIALFILVIFQLLALLEFSGMTRGKIKNFIATREIRTGLEKKVTKLASDSKQIKEKPQATEGLLESLPTIKDNYNLLEKLNSAAGTNQVSLLSVSFLPTKKSIIGGLIEQPIQISLRGEFENVFLFLDDLEKNKRPILVETLEMSTNEKVLSAKIVRTEILIKTFLVDSNQ